jgi:hypothetical protein
MPNQTALIPRIFQNKGRVLVVRPEKCIKGGPLNASRARQQWICDVMFIGLFSCFNGTYDPDAWPQTCKKFPNILVATKGTRKSEDVDVGAEIKNEAELNFLQENKDLV